MQSRTWVLGLRKVAKCLHFSVNVCTLFTLILNVVHETYYIVVVYHTSLAEQLSFTNIPMQPFAVSFLKNMSKMFCSSHGSVRSRSQSFSHPSYISPRLNNLILLTDNCEWKTRVLTIPCLTWAKMPLKLVSVTLAETRLM